MAEVRVRGLPSGGIAPRGPNGTPIGGTVALGASLQINRQMTKSENCPCSCRFVDGGTVIDKGRDFTQMARTSRPHTFRASLGIGLALITPGDHQPFLF